MTDFDQFYDVRGDAPYVSVLETVQAYMAQLPDSDRMDDWQYKKHIQNCITSRQLKCREMTTLSELIQRIYNSMREFDILTDFLKPETYTRLGIEEIYGRWNCIYVKTTKGKQLIQDTFPSPQVAADIVNRIAARYNQQINEGTPIALGEFAPNIRASFIGPPIASPELGLEFNIRIVHGSSMTKELLLSSGTACEDGLEFLESCIRYGANICIGGSTGSGKTGTMSYLLTTVTQNAELRVGTIEIESREFDLAKFDTDGKPLNDVFSLVTRASDDVRYNITANRLTEAILRFTPDIIGLGEMRNSEALAVSELALTGHGAITTLHANSASGIYPRIVDLCKKAGSSYDDTTLYIRAIKAFPILVFQKKLIDGSRKMITIAEGIDFDGKEATLNFLFQYDISDTEIASKTVVGKHQQVGTISNKLRERMIRNGASQKLLSKF